MCSGVTSSARLVYLQLQAASSSVPEVEASDSRWRGPGYPDQSPTDPGRSATDDHSGKRRK